MNIRISDLSAQIPDWEAQVNKWNKDSFHRLYPTKSESIGKGDCPEAGFIRENHEAKETKIHRITIIWGHYT